MSLLVVGVVVSSSLRFHNQTLPIFIADIFLTQRAFCSLSLEIHPLENPNFFFLVLTVSSGGKNRKTNRGSLCG